MDYLISIKVCALPAGSFIFIAFIGFLSSVKDLMLFKDRICIKDFSREHYSYIFFTSVNLLMYLIGCGN